MAAPILLVVDDDAGIRFPLRSFFSAKGYRVEEAGGYQQAMEQFHRTRPDAVVLDYLLPDGDALELMARMIGIDSDVPVVVLTAHGSIDLAVKAVKEGAEQFLTKPVELPALHTVVERVLANRRNRRKQAASATRQQRTQFDPFHGTSRAITQLRETAERLVETDRPVLILGETGCGKGVLARWLHENGPRSEDTYVDLNCAGLSRELLESELFGHEKGAFTSAVARKKGLLDVAHQGTLLLDEIGDMDEAVQPKLLKVLEEMRFRRLGDTRDRTVDIRLLAATHQDLQELVRHGQFRADLYFRISALPLKVPSLRERREDIPVLARFILDNLAAELGRPLTTLSRQAETHLAGYHWPGNIRELRNVLEYAFLLTDRNELMPRDLRLGEQPLQSTSSLPSGLTLKEVEELYIKKVLSEESGHVPRAAERLGVPRSTLYQKLKRLDGDDEAVETATTSAAPGSHGSSH